MFRSTALAIAAAFVLPCAEAAPVPLPEMMVADGMPPLPGELAADVGRYLEFRSASFSGWHPQRREMLISTRFGDTPQLHSVKMPGGARTQLTFLPEPVQGGAWRPVRGDCLVFSRDTGGGENYQLYRYDAADGKITLLTDGKSRNTGARWSRKGGLIAWASTARTGRDSDIWLMDPDKTESRRLLAPMDGGGWAVSDWSADGTRLLIQQYVSANDARFWLLDARTAEKTLLAPPGEKPVARDGGRFSADGTSIFLTSDEAGEFRVLGRMALQDRKFTPMTPDIPWDVEQFDLSPDGTQIALITNEDGASVLRIMAATDVTAAPAKKPALPAAVIGGLEWHPDGKVLGFSMTSARSPADAWSLEVATGSLTRWTESETGGLSTAAFPQPELMRVSSFDGLPVSGFLYRPDAAKFPGPRPVILSIHGGPEGQSRPTFQARTNYLLCELGIAVLYPNVRGSEGYGKTFLAKDNGLLRKDSVRDIGAFLDQVKADPLLDEERTAVTGGSYGGYMTLACMIDYADRLKAGCDIVGISNFLTFLTNTADYRRDLRRVEYGDERDPAVAAFLKDISPTAHAARIRSPLFVVQGQNDPRVPVTEAEQMVKAVRATGTPVWYLMARDEGHGFKKKANADYQFLATVQFWREHLLK